MIKPTTAYPRSLPGRAALVLPGRAALILAVLMVCACGSASHPAASAASPAAVTPSACEQVSAVLSNGPDPDADPVGYAEAQIRPLRQISTSNSSLRGVISQLSDAYQTFFASNGKNSNAKEAVAVASRKLNSICPGVAS
jgi:hypothetical protein